MFPAFVDKKHDVPFDKVVHFHWNRGLGDGDNRYFDVRDIDVLNVEVQFLAQRKNRALRPHFIDTRDIFFVVFDYASAQVVVFLVVLYIRIVANLVEDPDCLLKFIRGEYGIAHGLSLQRGKIMLPCRFQAHRYDRFVPPHLSSQMQQ